jgi:hypothetical protein
MSWHRDELASGLHSGRDRPGVPPSRLVDDLFLEAEISTRVKDPFGVSRQFRSEGVRVNPTSTPSGLNNRVTVWPHGSLWASTSRRYPLASIVRVAASMSATSNSIQAARSSGDRWPMSSSADWFPRTLLTLFFLPALYVVWFHIREPQETSTGAEPKAPVAVRSAGAAS